MDLRQLGMIQKVKEGAQRFVGNHPKLPMFLKAVSADALQEGTIIEMKITTPDGKNYCTNVKLQQDDMELFEALKTMQK